MVWFTPVSVSPHASSYLTSATRKAMPMDTKLSSGGVGTISYILLTYRPKRNWFPAPQLLYARRNTPPLKGKGNPPPWSEKNDMMFIKNKSTIATVAFQKPKQGVFAPPMGERNRILQIGGSCSFGSRNSK